jgi:hypothetical protein
LNIPPRPKSDLTIVLVVIAVIFFASVAGIINLFTGTGNKGAGPQPTSG